MATSLNCIIHTDFPHSITNRNDFSRVSSMLEKAAGYSLEPAGNRQQDSDFQTSPLSEPRVKKPGGNLRQCIILDRPLLPKDH